MVERRAVQQLPKKLANQIAAGEVVARPASVVKELCENAVDAGADRIVVEIEGGGITLVRIVDNGSGMSEQDARLAMRRHATSKLRSVEDLRSIATLGFRGEALPSIASVGRFVMRTRPAEEPGGIELRCDGGETPEVKPCGCAPGTTVELSDLFFNVPARRKFLRAVSTESAHVTEVVRDLALAHPRVGVELIRDGRKAKRWLPVATREERVRTTFEGHELIACLGERGPVQIEAYLSRPEKARSGASGLAIFVCGRPVRDRALARAVAVAYGELLDRGRFPVGVLYVELPLDLVDVNVHPQKAEVRFAQARAVTDAVYAVVSRAVADALGVTPMPKTQLKPTFPRPNASGDEAWTWSEPTDAPPEHPASARQLPAGRRFVATVRGRYLLYDDDAALRVVDGTRAQALRLLRKLTEELARGRIAHQRLLFPVTSPCDGDVGDAIEGAADALERLGFELRRTGPGHVAAHTLPRLIADGPAEALVAAVVDALRVASEPPYGIDVPALLERLAETTAASSPPPDPHELDDEEIAKATASSLRYDDLS